MANKRKRDDVTEEMRKRLRHNRNGVLTRDQWLDMVTEPMVTLLLLLPPLLLILGPRVRYLFRAWWLLLLVLLVVLVVPTLLRARRYARAAVHFGVFYAPLTSRPRWLTWLPYTLKTDAEREIKFRRRLAPAIGLRAEHAYLVYYLKERDENVLLSIAPADHPDAELWYPSKSFETRYERRTAP